MNECIDGNLYIICARNGRVGVYHEEDNSFIISRFKFSSNYLFPEYHWDTGEPYGTAKPLKDLGKSEIAFDSTELLAYLNIKEEEHRGDYEFHTTCIEI